MKDEERKPPEDDVPAGLEQDYREQKAAQKPEKKRSWFESLIAMLGI